MLHALLRHAVVAFPDTPSARAWFNRQFGALRGRHGPFPRSPAHWKGVLADAVEAFGGRSGDPKVRALADDLKGRANKGGAAPQRSASRLRTGLQAAVLETWSGRSPRNACPSMSWPGGCLRCWSRTGPMPRPPATATTSSAPCTVSATD
jgi:hypothetical protein